MKKLIFNDNCDLMMINWAHAVNSKSLLLEILKTEVHCIESDITYCLEDGLTYISHPPIYKSDFKFNDYWNLCKFHDKVFKLDFKMIEAVEPCLQFIDKMDLCKVIFNADILKSTTSKSVPMNPEQFINLCVKYATEAAISIGWTTVITSKIGYTWSDVYEMKKVLEKMHLQNNYQIITLPIDAHMLSLNSIPKFLWLLEQFPSKNISLTIWTYKDVKIDLNCLMSIRKILNKSSIFIDLPHLTESQRNILLEARPDSVKFNFKFDIERKSDFVFLSTNSFLIEEETWAQFHKKLVEEMNFFIVFDNIDRFANRDELSECTFYIQSQSNDVNITLTKKGIFCYVKNKNNIFEEHYYANSREPVYYCSLIEHESNWTFSIGTVENYNTSIVQWFFDSGISMNIEPAIRFIIKTKKSDCRFIAIDVVNNFLPLHIERNCVHNI